MTPVFKDGLRPQAVVTIYPPPAGLPSSMVMSYNTTQALDAVRKGQDDAATFLSGGAVPSIVWK